MIYMVMMPNKYVAAVIQGTRELSIHLQSIPNNVLNKLEIEKIHPKEYPIQILETEKDGKRYFIAGKSDKEMKVLKSTFELAENKLLTVYKIDKDFMGDGAGGDYMGALSHEHLTED